MRTPGDQSPDENSTASESGQCESTEQSRLKAVVFQLIGHLPIVGSLLNALLDSVVQSWTSERTLRTSQNHDELEATCWLGRGHKGGPKRPPMGERFIQVISNLCQRINASPPGFSVGRIQLSAHDVPKVAGVSVRRWFLTVVVVWKVVVVGTMTSGVLDAEPHNNSPPETSGHGESQSAFAGLRGVIYARVSSLAQAKAENSIPAQIDGAKQVAENHSIDLPFGAIKDEGKTGTNFNRTGIREVLRLAKSDEIDVILVSDIDRLGRTHVMTLVFIHLLSNRYGKTIIVGNQALNFSGTDGMILGTIQTLQAELSSRLKGERALRVKARNFLLDQKWTTRYNTSPLGYRITDDDWLAVSDRSAGMAMFEYFLETETYAGTARELNNNELSDRDVEINSDQVGKWLRKPVYLGRPEFSVDDISGLDHQGWVDDPDLAIVEEETFEEAQQLLQSKDAKHSSNEDAPGLDEIAEMFHYLYVDAVSPSFTLCCPMCGGELSKNGTDEMRTGLERHQYICRSETCSSQLRWPSEDEVERLELLERLAQNPEVRDQLLAE